MIGFRIMQAIGAGYLFPLSLTILHETFPKNERGTAMGIFMAGLSLGPAIGPWLGGYLIEQVSWRWIFYINIPIGLTALGVAVVTLPEGEPAAEKRSVDLLGLMAMASFVVPLLLAVSSHRNSDLPLHRTPANVTTLTQHTVLRKLSGVSSLRDFRLT